MKCDLCSKEINDYNAVFNQLLIDESHSVNICKICVDKFMHWHGKIISKLFPTKALKKRYEK